jgi:hypothetical protein
MHNKEKHTRNDMQLLKYEHFLVNKSQFVSVLDSVYEHLKKSALKIDAKRLSLKPPNRDMLKKGPFEEQKK